MFTKNRTILILGIFIALMPFLGFPYPYEEGLYIVTGLSVATLSYLLARHKRVNRKSSIRKSQKKEIVDSIPFVEEESVVQEEVSREALLGTIPDDTLETIQVEQESSEKTEQDKPYNT